jgi:predicted component of viral defense system (DUF524 family)
MPIDPSIVFPDPAVGLKIVSAYTGKTTEFLQENGRYEYEVLSVGHALKEKNGTVRRSRLADGFDRGSIEPGNYVGLLKLELLDRKTGETVAATHIDVRSTKLGYEDDYRAMLEDIADRCADFLLQLESPVDQRFVPEDEASEATLAQRLYFLKSLLGGEDFQLAVQRIVTLPNTQWREAFRTVDVRRSRRLGRGEAKQFASAGRRMNVPQRHPLSGVMATIPERIEVRDKRDTVDTPENRFVKHALTMFLQTLEELLDKFPNSGNPKYPGLRLEIGGLINDLEKTLAHDVFRQVSQPEFLPLNSPVLQRKEGYRQVLRVWMLFGLAAKLSWEGGDDVYEGGKRDAAALYEYWVFFKLLDLVAGMFELKNPPVEALINDQDLVLKLKAGKQLPIKGVYSGAGRRLRVEFSYNRTFGVADAYPAPGSWSRQMRPDYTLSLWPDGFTQQQAEEQELMTHVHFDAKYKVDSLRHLFGGRDDNLDMEKSEQRAGHYRRADLLKMHAYRDAIRRSAGAYVLYPGNEQEHSPFRGFHELLPGLGAFPLRPDKSDDGSAALERFLKEVVAHVCNRATQHEQTTYHTYRIHEKKPPQDGAVYEMLPERRENSRSMPAAETYVIHGWLKGAEHLDWIRARGLYNFRTEKRRGSLRLHHSVAGASYLLLHGDDEYRGGGRLFKIISEGPRVFSKEKLVELDYPGSASQAYYLVYDVEPLDSEDPLALYDWDLRPIDGIDEGRGSPVPRKGIPLSDFMKGARAKS